MLLDILGKLGRIILDPRIVKNKINQNRLVNKEPANASGTHSSRRVNYLFSNIPYSERNYLEIGVAHGYTFEAVNSPKKTGVDPFLKCRIKKSSTCKFIETTSEYYFKSLHNVSEKFDVIFIDGSHTFHEAYLDIINALNSLTPNGFVLVDDTVPEDEFSALPDHSLCNSQRKLKGIKRETWSGDVFRAIVAISKFHTNIGIQTIIGPQHPQTIMWRIAPSGNETPISQGQISEVRLITFNELFSSFENANSIFNFGLERNILKKIGVLNE